MILNPTADHLLYQFFKESRSRDAAKEIQCNLKSDGQNASLVNFFAQPKAVTDRFFVARDGGTRDS